MGQDEEPGMWIGEVGEEAQSSAYPFGAPTEANPSGLHPWAGTFPWHLDSDMEAGRAMAHWAPGALGRGSSWPHGHPNPSAAPPYPVPGGVRGAFLGLRLFLTPGTPLTPHRATPGIRGFPLFMGCLCPWATLTPGRFGLEGVYVGLTVH